MKYVVLTLLLGQHGDGQRGDQAQCDARAHEHDAGFREGDPVRLPPEAEPTVGRRLVDWSHDPSPGRRAHAAHALAVCMCPLSRGVASPGLAVAPLDQTITAVRDGALPTRHSD